MRTVFILLVWVWHQSTVIFIIQDAIIIIVIITLVPEPILIGVQLRAVNDVGAVVFGVLMTISITGTKTSVINLFYIDRQGKR